MTIASFEDLCCGVCELEGSPTPPLARDDEGNLAIALAIDGVEVTLTHEPARSATHAFLLAAFGPLPQGGELAACRALMDTNAALLRRGGACFSRHPQTGDVTLLHPYAFTDASPVDLYGRVRELAGVVHRWRRQEFMPTAATAAAREARF